MKLSMVGEISGGIKLRIGILMLALVLPFLPFVSDYLLHIAILIYLYMILALGLNIVPGFNGLLDLGRFQKAPRVCRFLRHRGLYLRAVNDPFRPVLLGDHSPCLYQRGHLGDPIGRSHITLDRRLFCHRDIWILRIGGLVFNQ